VHADEKLTAFAEPECAISKPSVHKIMRRWRAGESRANAWREAQLTLLRSKDFSNPFFWSAFTLTGQWR
jgi:CHAT domain-containing protein